MTPAPPSFRSVSPRDLVADAIDESPVSLPMCVTMTDIDGFADLNEHHGREAGDAVLAGFDNALDQNLPDSAIIHRIGGDEWVVALPGTTLETGLVLFEELRAHIASSTFGDDNHQFTVSAGLGARPPHGTTGNELMRCATEALNRAKRDGRNRVTIFVEDKMVMKSNYYSRATLDRLSALSRATNRTEASLLREAIDRMLDDHAELT